MQLKWYISVLVIVLTLLGVGQHQIAVPNQEIVVQFSKEVSSEKTRDAIVIVKKQLQSAGVDNIQVYNEASGLRITYYSVIDVESIKELLDESNLELDYASSNQSNKSSKENSNIYNLDVYEIQKGNEYDLDFDGFVLEQKPENPRYSSPNLYFSKEEIDIKDRHRFTEVKFVIQRNIAIAIDNTLHKIPEVRAGPTA